MSSLTDGTINPGSPEPLAFRQIVEKELFGVRNDRAALMVPRGHRALHLVVLAGCVLINAVFFFSRLDYIGLFIAASFYLNMYYFITLILPTNFEKSRVPAADLSRLRIWLKEVGVTTGTSQFTRLFINSLFINSRGLSLGIGLIFSVDIILVLVHYYEGLPLRTAVIVLTQCAIIVIFYLLVWKMEPFSTTYVEKVEQAKKHLHRRNLPPRFVAAVFLFGFMLAIFLFLTTIIYLPGVTLKAFLNQSELTELGHLFSLIAVLGISQYFIIRYIHGITSRTMAERLFDAKEDSLRDLLDAGESESLLPDENPEGNALKKSSQLLESKIFIVKRSTIGGTFPVFIVDLDFSVLMDTTTLTALKGYIVEGKH